MKKLIILSLLTSVFLVASAGSVFLVRLFVLEAEKEPETEETDEVIVTQPPDSAVVRAVVEEFGKRLKSVPLQAAPDQIRAAIIEQYADYVSPELLAVWVVEPSLAPGRLTSSPWPDRIEIREIQEEGDGRYAVTGYVVEVTSAEFGTEEAAVKLPIALELEKEGDDWLITNVSLDQSILFEVPFSPQAPFANWLDPRQNYSCEETTALMAVKWAKGEALTLQEAEETIIDVAEWQLERYGEFRDTSARDTVDRIFKEYFGYHNVELRSGITAGDIKQTLWDGNIVIVPVRGRELENPYYTPPGPLIHMVVVVGYDAKTQEFITNDPGTKRGKQLRYHENILVNAIRDYVSGYNEPLTDSEKTMIVVSPDDEVLSGTI